MTKEELATYKELKKKLESELKSLMQLGNTIPDCANAVTMGRGILALLTSCITDATALLKAGQEWKQRVAQLTKEVVTCTGVPEKIVKEWNECERTMLWLMESRGKVRAMYKGIAEAAEECLALVKAVKQREEV